MSVNHFASTPALRARMRRHAAREAWRSFSYCVALPLLFALGCYLADPGALGQVLRATAEVLR